MYARKPAKGEQDKGRQIVYVRTINYYQEASEGGRIHFSKNETGIIWLNRLGLRSHPIPITAHALGTDLYIENKHLWSPASVKLVVPNQIPFDELYRIATQEKKANIITFSEKKKTA